MEPRKYLVRAVRPVFQAAYLEVEASDPEQAIGVALECAKVIPDERWRGRFDPDYYQMDFHCVRSGATADGCNFSLLDFPHYSFLSTNPSPVGSPGVVQPWMNGASPIMAASVLSEWIDQLVSKRRSYYYRAIETIEGIKHSFEGPDKNVLPLKHPEERRFDIEVTNELLRALRILCQASY